MILTCFGAAALLAPVLAPHDPGAPLGRADLSLRPPCAEAWLGTDIESRDLLSRMLFGARVSLLTAFLATAAATCLGAAAGAAAGAFGGRLDSALMRLTDFFLAVPGIVVLLAAGTILGPSQETLVGILALTGWMGTARLVRAEIRVLREREFVHAAVGLGLGPVKVLTRHVLPHVLAPVCISALLGFGGFLAAESIASFLGFGVPDPAASWGKMVRDGMDRMREGWWVSTWPALAISLCVTAAVLLGESLRESREA
jgi:peptide/nickel transport system permease protein